MKYCQGPKCHIYDTSDRKRGPKDNRRNETRKRSNFYYGSGDFCTLGCQDDWWAENGTRAVNHFGRIQAPIILKEENAWQRQYNNGYWNDNTQARYHEVNIITKATRPTSQE
tara:strand:+ start:661 stop:996 length:336 start_codon:yes stop_codon:yes gene_type:complete